MARRQEEIVIAIRRQRQALRREIDAFLALEPLKVQIRDHPGPWVVGGVLAGAVASRLLIAPLWSRRRRLALSWLRSRLRSAVLALITASVRQSAAGAPALAPTPRTEPRAPRSEAPRRGRSRRALATAGRL